MRKNIFYVFIFLVLTGCKTEKISLKFLNEFVVKDSLKFEKAIVGGISGIDFYNNKYYMVIDDARNPRILVGDILIKEDSIKSVDFKQTIRVDSVNQFYKNNVLDLESIFVVNDQINLVSEGSIRKGKSPAIFTVNSFGKIKESIEIPSYFKANSIAKPKHNATFESSSKSIDKKGYWVAMEGPLQADGEEPTFHKTKSPVRITYFNNETKKPIIEIIIPALLVDREKGKKFIKVYWDGIKFTIKFVDAEAMIIKTKAKIITSKLSNFPRISVGFVSILFIFSGSCLKKASIPETINNAKNEKINKFKIKLKFPFLS